MDFVNQTKVAAGWTMGFARDGRELVIVAVKATFTIPENGDEATLAPAQVPLVEADTFTGDPGMSAPLYESDYAHRKPACDVLLNGTAYAPPGKAVRSIEVGLRVGRMAKSFRVVGNRVWRKGMRGIRVSEPEMFERMPVSYDNAFGGTDRPKDNPDFVRTFVQNPVGRGYSYFRDAIDGRPLPNTEEARRPVEQPNGDYCPMALGAIGRNWMPRARHAGTYDQKWLEERAPFWPDDFNECYFQAAPLDQQVAYPTGGELVALQNLTPRGATAFALPALSMPVWFVPYRGQDTRVDAVLDTVLIEPDLARFTLTWRAVQPMRQSCFDMKQVIAGDMPEAWKRARTYGEKPYYKGLAELIEANRRRSGA